MELIQKTNNKPREISIKLNTMMQNGKRLIRVNKSELIDKIKENKANHIKEYDKAVIAYKEEAQRQLEDQINKVKDGALIIKLNLISPVNAVDNYDEMLQTFEWEVQEEVELSIREFQECVLDKNDFVVSAKFSNQSYLG
jgi:hypothetical protein